ncbi:MAG TPA: LD-carboxypeptidase [Spirochaetales bacterium]|nr:LD-carboxypeptidase [Spirochaetales bacterium]HPS15174.1 LD-carboxypeptidase [Spirochaetales bacterium]
MTKTKPVHLKKGDLVSLVAPSGPIADTQRLETAKLAVEKLGLRTKVSTHAADRYGYLAGDDATRAQEFTEAFADTETKAVICLKGGYGAQRILARLDFGVICRNPKILLGYSDITALHVALSQVCHLVTFHGPMPSSDMIPEMDNWTETSLRRAIFSTDPLGAIRNPDDSRMLDTLVPGRARGELVGGNLSLLASGLGTPWEIDTRGKILFLEDVDEAPYRVDRMLNQLKLAGKLDECAGIVLGMWTRCVAPEGKPSLELGEVFRDIVAPSRKPTLVGLQAGHCAPNLVLPFGIQYELCTDEGRLEALEPACI